MSGDILDNSLNIYYYKNQENTTVIVGCPELHVLPLCMYVQIKFCISIQVCC